MNAHHYNPYTWSWDSGKTRPDEGTVDADSQPPSTGVALSAFAAKTMAAGAKTSITDLTGDLLAFIYSAFIPELLIPHLAVCQRFRNVLLGVETVMIAVDASRIHLLTASSLTRFRGEVRLVLYTCDDADENTVAFSHLANVVGKSAASMGMTSLEIIHEGQRLADLGTPSNHAPALTCMLRNLSLLVAACTRSHGGMKHQGDPQVLNFQTFKIQNIDLTVEGALFLGEALVESRGRDLKDHEASNTHSCRDVQGREALRQELEQMRRSCGCDGVSTAWSALRDNHTGTLQHLHLDSCSLGLQGAQVTAANREKATTPTSPPGPLQILCASEMC